MHWSGGNRDRQKFVALLIFLLPKGAQHVWLFLFPLVLSVVVVLEFDLGRYARQIGSN